jgi:hypothetical protein
MLLMTSKTFFLFYSLSQNYCLKSFQKLKTFQVHIIIIVFIRVLLGEGTLSLLHTETKQQKRWRIEYEVLEKKAELQKKNVQTKKNKNVKHQKSSVLQLKCN